MQPVMMAPMQMMQQPMMMGGPIGSSTLDHELAGDELSVSLLLGSFFNYVDKILPHYSPLAYPLPVDIFLIR